MSEERACQCIRKHNTCKPNTLKERLSKTCSECKHLLSIHTKDGYCVVLDLRNCRNE
jgi:hypothetical protein